MCLFSQLTNTKRGKNFENLLLWINLNLYLWRILWVCIHGSRIYIRVRAHRMFLSRTSIEVRRTLLLFSAWLDTSSNNVFKLRDTSIPHYFSWRITVHRGCRYGISSKGILTKMSMILVWYQLSRQHDISGKIFYDGITFLTHINDKGGLTYFWWIGE